MSSPLSPLSANSLDGRFTFSSDSVRESVDVEQGDNYRTLNETTSVSLEMVNRVPSNVSNMMSSLHIRLIIVCRQKAV